MIVFSLVEDPKVISVFPNLPRKLHTTRSWEFLGLTKDGQIPDSSAWKAGRYGEDVVIGTIDTGESYILFYFKIDCFFISQSVKKYENVARMFLAQLTSLYKPLKLAVMKTICFVLLL